MKYFLTLALVFASFFAFSQTKEKPSGSIKGTVADENGNPVFKATVYAIPQEASLDNISPRSTTTNEAGEFDFHSGFALGSYKLYSSKDAEGYPDRSDSFYAEPKFEAKKVELTEDRPSATAKVDLGEKAAVLSGHVIDAATGAPLKAKLVFMDEDGNSHSVFVTGKYRTLLPAGKDVTLMVLVMSEDYDSQAPVPALRLASGQEMDMDIPLSKKTM
jgi:hypothetical protein